MTPSRGFPGRKKSPPAPPGGGRPKRMGPRAIVVYCGLLLSLGAFSIDITLPFFGRMRDSLGASDAAAHATVTLYMFALAIGQLVFGSVSDRYGRRPVIVGGLALYAIGALVAFLAPTIGWVLAGRALQGLGGAVGPVIGRAMVRDVSSGPALAKNMAVASGVFSFGPIFAPLLGVGIGAVTGGWRGVFVVMALLAASLLVAMRWLPETLPERRMDALQPRAIARNAATLFAHRQSRYFLLLAGFVMISIVTIVSGMARVYEVEWGVSGAPFAVLFGVHGFGIILGQMLNHRLIGRIGPVASAIVASIIMSAGCGLAVLFGLLGLLTPVLLAVFTFQFAIGYLMVFANATSLTLEPHGRIAGFTSAFFGFFAMLVSSSVGTAVVTLVADSALAWSAALLAISLACFGALVRWQRRR